MYLKGSELLCNIDGVLDQNLLKKYLLCVLGTRNKKPVTGKTGGPWFSAASILEAEGLHNSFTP